MELRKLKVPKAVALLSGGLDSALAAKLVKDQNVEVIGLHLTSPFACRTHIHKTADELGIPLVIRDKGEAYLEIVKNPKFGYGRGANPCIDCRLYMFLMANIVMEEHNADFIITGEVLGQRPMSQHRRALLITEEKSHLTGKILRPLSAHSLAPTIAEEEGWVDRSKLFRFTGRGRREQLDLAKKLGILEFGSPGGGCLLTEVGFSVKVKDFFKHEYDKDPKARVLHSSILKLGRHFRFPDETKVIVARNNEENEELKKYWPEISSTLFRPLDFEGPVALAFGELSKETQLSIGAIMLRYGKRQNFQHSVSFSGPGSHLGTWAEKSETFTVENSISEETLSSIRL